MSQYQKGIINRYFEHRDTIMLDRLGQIVSDLYLSEGGKSTEKLWQTAGEALAKTAADPARARKILAERDIKALAQLVGELQVPDKGKPQQTSNAPAQPAARPATAPPTANSATPSGAASGAGGAGAGPTPDDLKMALKAFKKRLKLTKLDEESKLGRSPLSTGGKSQITAIIPPNQYPRAIWEELAKQGKLKNTGGGFYQLLGE